jgi:hypothetical protein
MYKTFEENFFLKGYIFYSKGDNEMGLKVSYFIMPLFVKAEFFTYNIIMDLGQIERVGWFKKTQKTWWDVRKEQQAATFEQINKTIDMQGETFLNKINCSKDFFNLLKKDRKDNVRVWEDIAYASILFKNIRFQNRMLRGVIREAKDDDRDLEWVEQIKTDAEQLLRCKNIEERKSILKSWANYTMSHLKLPHLKPFAV